MAIEESKEGMILSSVANYQTVNILELMSLTPGLNDEEVRETVGTMEKNNLVNVNGEGDEQFVSVTTKGYNFLSQQQKLMQLGSSASGVA
jgi:predicted transcriptional regulator